jgi:hypothetical protein
MGRTASYDDGRVMLDADGITLRRYYFPTGAGKHIAYGSVRAVGTRPMTWLTGRGRGWGTAHPGYWLPLDLTRPGRDTLVVLDVGRRIKPAFTPDDPERVVELIRLRAGLPTGT